MISVLSRAKEPGSAGKKREKCLVSGNVVHTTPTSPIGFPTGRVEISREMAGGLANDR